MCCAGEFGVVYRGSLIGWPTKGEQGVVAIKTLKGMIFPMGVNFIQSGCFE